MKKKTKRILKGFLLTVIITTVFISTAVGAQVKDTIDVLFNTINIKINGEEQDIDNFLYEGTTYVPLRDISNLLHKEVSWDSDTNTANIDNKINDIFDEMYNKEDKHSKEEIRKHIFDEREELKEKELEILKENNIKLFTKYENNEGIIHINAAYINDYPEYMGLYIDYMNDHIGIGDYMSSGLYVDEDLNIVYFVSISDKQVYTYKLDN